MSLGLIGDLRSSSVIARHPENPILTAQDVPYPAMLVFNPGVTKVQGKYVMVFRNDIAVQLLSASVAAGYEAPLRIYVTEGADGDAMLSYRLPSAVFAPYRNAKIDSLARQLDATLAKIVNDAGGG